MTELGTKWAGIGAACLVWLLASTASGDSVPNVVVLLADDMGFGELQCLNPDRGKIPTPRLDELAAGGLVFLDGHSGSSVCTPTRYGLMTGRYAWRTRLQSGVLTGGESLIAADRWTVPKMLRSRGYRTAMVGKWHLGMYYDGEKNTGKIPIGAKITHGPIDRGGFDQFWGFHHARQMNLWIEDDRVVEHITPVEMLPRLAQTAVDFIHQAADDDQPFFLYVPWNSPHSPVAPAPEWQGKSGLNAHADFVMQTDDAFGQVIDALNATGQTDRTLVICSSDNGTSAPTSKMKDLHRLGHYPSGGLRGSKADIWDGGHRVPFLVHWPDVIDRGQRTEALVCLTDLMATLAEITGGEIPDDAGEDSVSFYDVMRDPESPSRNELVHHSVEGQFAIRRGRWKLVCCPGSGGWSQPKTVPALIEAGKEGPFVQLYDLHTDPAEQNNLAVKMPEKVNELRKRLDQQIAQGRSTPGPPQANDATVIVDKWKSLKSRLRRGQSLRTVPNPQD